MVLFHSSPVSPVFFFRKDETEFTSVQLKKGKCSAITIGTTALVHMHTHMGIKERGQVCWSGCLSWYYVVEVQFIGYGMPIWIT